MAKRKYEASDEDRLVTPAQAAAVFGVDPKTVSRWAQAGKLTAVRTLGGIAVTARCRFSRSSADSASAPL